MLGLDDLVENSNFHDDVVKKYQSCLVFEALEQQRSWILIFSWRRATAICSSCPTLTPISRKHFSSRWNATPLMTWSCIWTYFTNGARCSFSTSLVNPLSLPAFRFASEALLTRVPTIHPCLIVGFRSFQSPIFVIADFSDSSLHLFRAKPRSSSKSFSALWSSPIDESSSLITMKCRPPLTLRSCCPSFNPTMQM